MNTFLSWLSSKRFFILDTIIFIFGLRVHRISWISWGKLWFYWMLWGLFNPLTVLHLYNWLRLVALQLPFVQPMGFHYLSSCVKACFHTGQLTRTVKTSHMSATVTVDMEVEMTPLRFHCCPLMWIPKQVFSILTFVINVIIFQPHLLRKRKIHWYCSS